MPVSYNGCLCRSCLERDPARSWIRHDRKMLYVQRIILTGDPVSKEGCAAVAVLRGHLAFCRVAYGEAKSCWTVIHQPEGVFVEDVVLWNDRLYVLHNDGQGVCNLEDPNLNMENRECDSYVGFITGFKVHSQLISNKIYFSDSSLVGHDDQLVHDIGIFNLETRRMEPLPVAPMPSWCLPLVWLTQFLTGD
ncbi:hypothetical protein Droror1_Dr00019866 [Drosera rotundifolia]